MEGSRERTLWLPQKRRRPVQLLDPGPDFLRPSPIIHQWGGRIEAGKERVKVEGIT